MQTALAGPHRLVGPFDGITVRQVISGPTSQHTIAITDSGVFAWGRKDLPFITTSHARTVQPNRIRGYEPTGTSHNNATVLMARGVVPSLLHGISGNNKGQLGVGDDMCRPGPSPVTAFSMSDPVIHAATGK